MTNIRVRVGQQNAVKVVSSISGAAIAGISENVIGGIASVSQLSVSGVSTFSGNVYINADFTATNGNITRTLFVGEEIYYPPGGPFSVAYFDQNRLLVSTGSTFFAMNESNYVLSTNELGVPTWSNAIDGGEY